MIERFKGVRLDEEGESEKVSHDMFHPAQGGRKAIRVFTARAVSSTRDIYHMTANCSTTTFTAAQKVSDSEVTLVL